jgi:PTH1 family peptidyl-tRNA hydrolase
MWLVTGLGNPGSKYAMTRHNVGFMVMDVWMNSIKAGNYRDEFKAETKKFKLDIEKASEEILVLKPQTFMNLSGQSRLKIFWLFMMI